MKHSFTSPRGHSLEVRESGRSTKLFLSINGTFIRIDDQPLKPAIVTALLQEIVKLKSQVPDMVKLSLDNCPTEPSNLIDDEPEYPLVKGITTEELRKELGLNLSQFKIDS